MRYRRFLTPRTVAAGVAVIVLVVVFGPTFVAPESGMLPPPSDSAVSTPATSTADDSQDPLPTVAGSQVPEPLVEVGESSVRGSVDVPEGRLPGATVRIERLVGDRAQTVDVATAADGTFTVAGLPGGRYRVRAWLAPEYTTPEPEIFFLTDGDDAEIHLRAEQVRGVVVRAITRPEAPIIGQGVNIAVWVADRSVAPDGFAREQGRPGVRVSLSVTGFSEVDPGVVRTTDASGTAVFSFSCERVTSTSVTARVGAAVPEPEPPVTPPTSSSTTTTTTTVPVDAGDQVGAPGVVDEVVALDVPDCIPEPTTTTAPDDEGADPPSSTGDDD